MEEGRGQTDSQVGGRHLVLGHAGRHVAQQTQQSPQRLAVLVGQQHHGGTGRLQTELFRHVWRGREPWFVFNTVATNNSRNAIFVSAWSGHVCVCFFMLFFPLW